VVLDLPLFSFCDGFGGRAFRYHELNSDLWPNDALRLKITVPIQAGQIVISLAEWTNVFYFIYITLISQASSYTNTAN
jgi:hypothetical protein